MKSLIVVSLSVFTFTAFASQDLDSMKASANKQLDEQINTLQSSKTCVRGATTVDAFKACKVDEMDSGIQREEEVIRTRIIEKNKASETQAP